MFIYHTQVHIVHTTIKVEIMHEGEVEYQILEADVPDTCILEQFKNICFNMYGLVVPVTVTLIYGDTTVIYMNRAAIERQG